MLIKQRAESGAKRRSSGSMASEARSEAFQCYMYLILPIIGFLVLSVYPILWSMKWSLYLYDMTPSTTKFIGLTNFIRMFTEDFTYWRMWGNTILFALLKIPFETVFTLLIALILSNNLIRGKSFFRTMYFMPTVIGSVIVGLVFSNMFSYFGVVNECLTKLGMISEPVDWLSSRAGAYFMLVVFQNNTAVNSAGFQGYNASFDTRHAERERRGNRTYKRRTERRYAYGYVVPDDQVYARLCGRLTGDRLRLGNVACDNGYIRVYRYTL